MFKTSKFYRNDVWIGRYCASPWSAWTHLAAALGMIWVMLQTPAIEIGWGWLVFIVVPGVWLLITGMIFAMRLTAKVVGFDHVNSLLADGDRRWSVLLFSREAASLVLLVATVVLSFSWYHQRPFDSEDFRRCVGHLGVSGQATLAKIANENMTRDEFAQACYSVYSANKPVPLPRSLAELKAKQQLPLLRQ